MICHKKPKPIQYRFYCSGMNAGGICRTVEVSSATTGCGPTNLAMVVLYLTGDKTVTPASVAEYAESAGYSVPGSGSSWTLISEGCEHYGIHAEEVPMDEDRIKAKLDEGCLIIINVGPGDFTDSGHFITIIGYDRDGFIINDSNSRTNSKKDGHMSS